MSHNQNEQIQFLAVDLSSCFVTSQSGWTHLKCNLSGVELLAGKRLVANWNQVGKECSSNFFFLKIACQSSKGDILLWFIKGLVWRKTNSVNMLIICFSSAGIRTLCHLLLCWLHNTDNRFFVMSQRALASRWIHKKLKKQRATCYFWSSIQFSGKSSWWDALLENRDMKIGFCCKRHDTSWV